MINPFQKINRLNSCAGIEIHLLPDNRLRMSVCLIELDKDELQIKQKFEASSLEEVIKQIPISIPVAITITGKGVLLKKGSIDNNSGKQNLDAFFSNLKPEQFYIQYFNNNKNYWAGIVRKGLVDELIETFKKNKVNILNISLGPFSVEHILQQINVYGEELVFDGHVVKISHTKELEDYSYVKGNTSSFSIKIGIEPLGEQFVLAYSAAFQLALYQSLSLVKLENHESEYLFEEYLQRLKFRHNAINFLMGLFLLLLINFLVLQYYSSMNNELLLKVNNYTADAEQIRNKEGLIKKNEELLKELGWSKGINFAWLADQIGQTVPASIILSELDINPVEESRLKKNDYQQGLIRIKGKTSILSDVNNWLDRLQENDWVKQVELKHFSPLDDDGRQQFTILIKF
jgi:hypothetical protein